MLCNLNDIWLEYTPIPGRIEMSIGPDFAFRGAQVNNHSLIVCKYSISLFFQKIFRRSKIVVKIIYFSRFVNVSHAEYRIHCLHCCFDCRLSSISMTIAALAGYPRYCQIIYTLFSVTAL